MLDGVARYNRVTLTEVRIAVLAGRWDKVGALCDSIVSGDDGDRLVLDQLRRQAALHAQAARVLTSGSSSMPKLPSPADAIQDAGVEISRAAWRNFAALDGDRALAAALLQEGRPARASLGPGLDSRPRLDVACVTRSRLGADRLRVIGVARPAADDVLALGDGGSPAAFPVRGAVELVARGTPVEVVGRWRGETGTFECESFVPCGEVPDYRLVCAAIEKLWSLASLPTEPMQVRVVPVSQLDHYVTRSRSRRRVGEWDAARASADILEGALNSCQLSLETLLHVHELVLDPSTAGVGQLRQTPAVIRWCGVITYRAPPVAEARRRTCRYLAKLVAELQERGGSARHPATLAADAAASLSSFHPFADGNGRVSRAVATWLLLRSGFRRRAKSNLSTLLDANLAEHYQTLRNVHVSPWGWHQLFYDAVLATFERVSPLIA
jgi:fido (protein-threonine AMPylation protein)